MNLNWLCKIGIHKWRFKEYCHELSYKGCRCKCGHLLHGMSVETWIEECQRCKKEKFENDIPLG